MERIKLESIPLHSNMAFTTTEAPTAERISFAEPVRPREYYHCSFPFPFSPFLSLLSFPFVTFVSPSSILFPVSPLPLLRSHTTYPSLTPSSPGLYYNVMTASSYGGPDDENIDHSEDWTKTTHEKDSWATRERRRSNKFAKIDHDVAQQRYERSRSGRRASSTLGIFFEGVDSEGNPIIRSGNEKFEEFEMPPGQGQTTMVDKDGKRISSSPTIAIVFDERRLSMSEQNSDRRRGSILSLWKTGKDKDGNDHIHSGHEGEDWVDAVSQTSGSAPNSPRLLDETNARGDRRGSILSIWKQGRDRDGHTVIHSGEEHDEIIIPLDEHGVPIELPAAKDKDAQAEKEMRVGSILSIWSQGKDKEGKTVIHSGEEHDGALEVPAEKTLESPKMRGQERRGSVLSMWSEDKRDAQERPAPVALKVFTEDDEEVFASA